MLRTARWGWTAALALACSVPNPAFDPRRDKDTEAVDSSDDDDDDDGTTLASSSDGGDATDESDSDSGPLPGLCNNAPEEHVGLRILDMAGNPAQRCGTLTERECTLVRNDAEARWELRECCLGDDLCPPETAYVLEFTPTGPAVVADPLHVRLRVSYRPADLGCDLEWVQIDSMDPALPEVPPHVYMAAASLEANPFVWVKAEAGDELPDEVCECAEADADCCPDELGRHFVHLTAGMSTFTLDPTAPSHVEPTPLPEVATELIVVRAWQPPICDRDAQYEWIVRRLWL